MRHPDHPDEQDYRAMEAERDAWSARYPQRWVRVARPAEPEPDLDSICRWALGLALLAILAILTAFVAALAVFS